MMMKRFFASNSGVMRLLRTITQGIIAVLISNVDIMFSSFEWNASERAIVVAIVIATLTPLYKALAEDEPELEDIEVGNGLEHDEMGTTEVDNDE